MNYFRCKCFLTDNYFISKYRIHIKYDNSPDFWSNNQHIWESITCNDADEKRQIIDTVRHEYERRSNLDAQSKNRINFIKDNYVPLLPEVYHLRETFLDPRFVSIVNQCLRGDTIGDILKSLKVICAKKRIYQLPVFTQQYCSDLMSEIIHFNESSMPKGRPNTMNNYGVLLNELLSFSDTFITPLREKYLNPLSKVLFPEWCGDSLDTHRAFTVKYNTNEDDDLAMHFDNGEVTLNVCIGKEFEGNELFFGLFRGINSGDDTIPLTPVTNIVSWGVLHLSQQMHGAMPIESGERHNVVIWMRSSKIRNQLCPMCDSKPILVPALGFGDGFTK